MEFTMNLENLSQERELEHTERLFEIETEYMAAQGFFQNAEAHHLRQMAIFNIKQLVETPGLDYDPFVPFLALTYFDRCASWHPIPDDLEFLTTFVYSCTVLAWKMRSSDFSVRLLLDEVEDLKRMEQRILDALDWKMLSITAVFFIDFFVSLIVVHDNDPRKILPVVNPRRILNHVFFMHYHTEFTRFKPSIIAAVGVVAERSEKGPPGDSCVDPILRCKFVDMDEFENCFDLLRFKRATEIANAALIPRIDFPESLSPPAQQEEQEEDTEEDSEEDTEEDTEEEEEEAEEEANAAVIHGGGRRGRKRRRVVIGEKAEVLSYGRASVNPF